jgi:hypothetical protein
MNAKLNNSTTNFAFFSFWLTRITFNCFDQQRLTNTRTDSKLKPIDKPAAITEAAVMIEPYNKFY